MERETQKPEGRETRTVIPTKAQGQRPSRRRGQRDLSPRGRPRGRVPVGELCTFATPHAGCEGQRLTGLGAGCEDSRQHSWTLGAGACCPPGRLPQRPAPGCGSRFSGLRLLLCPPGCGLQAVDIPGNVCADRPLSSDQILSAGFLKGSFLRLGTPLPGIPSAIQAQAPRGGPGRPGEARATAGPGSPGPSAGAQRWARSPHGRSRPRDLDSGTGFTGRRCWHVPPAVARVEAGARVSASG